MSETVNQNESTGHKSALVVNGDTEVDDLVTKWALDDWTQLYRIAIKFYRDNESKAFHPTYDTRNQFMAFILQEKYGNFDTNKAKPLGTLDIVGKDRRNSWISLTNTDKQSAQRGFVQLLNQLCPLFDPYVKAMKLDFDEKERLRREAQELEDKRAQELHEKERLELELKRAAERETREREEQKRAIQEALNRQTIQQFKSYAEQQYPANIEQQNDLIRQLQEQHYQQYLLQLGEQQLTRTHNQNMNNTKNNFVNNDNETTVRPTNNSQSNTLVTQTVTLEPQMMAPDDQQNNHLEPTTGSESDSEDESFGPIAGASMWTRKDIALFKESIRSEGGDGIIKVGHGEIVTVRVPTHRDGTCIFWEFSTDSYDIGFGLLFEWTKNPGNQVSVHISESEDEDEDEEEGEIALPNDIEKGASLDPEKEAMSPKSQTDSSPISVIIPIYRRDSHEEVFSGSHVYPGSGVYLLKFDNSYSLWRSKTLYYRVYYTR